MHGKWSQELSKEETAKMLLSLRWMQLGRGNSVVDSQIRDFEIRVQPKIPDFIIYVHHVGFLGYNIVEDENGGHREEE